MNTIKSFQQSRRVFLQSAAAVATIGLMGVLPLVVRAASDVAKTLKIGIVGSGRIGGTLGELWVKAGHQVMFSSLDIEHDRALAARLGSGARAGTPKEAAAFGDVVLISVPYAALPQLGRDPWPFVSDANPHEVIVGH